LYYDGIWIVAGLKRFTMSKTRNTTINKKKSILDISVAVEATPLNPKRPATIAIMRKTKAQYNIINSLLVKRAP
jgi:hypothetical protein